jgi:transcriptional regulator with XRE-family HTH domain
MSLDHKIAKELKALRLQNSLSLDDLAKLSSVSRASISRIENAEVSPTTQVLARLCKVLGIGLSALMIRCEPDTPLWVKADQQTQWHDPVLGFTRRCVSPPHSDYNAEILHCELAAGASIDYDSAPANELDHHLYLQAGQLKLTINDQAYLLQAGDCLRYKLSEGNRFEVIGTQKAEYLLVLVKRD